MTLQIVSSARSRAENALHLTRCVPLVDLNFSSNILFQLHGAGSQEAGMIKSVGSVFENSVIADCSLGHLFNMCPFLEPAANMIYRRNLYVNVTTTGAGACGACLGPEKQACQSACPQCPKHQQGCNRTAANACRHACANRCGPVCGTGPAIPGQPMPPTPAGTLDTTVNANTGHTLLSSARLSGRPDYQFELGPPPGWPPLSVNDSVVKEWDRNLYFGVSNYSGAYSSDCPPGACNLTNATHGQSEHWDANAMYRDPLLQRSARSLAAPWDSECTDYTPAPDSPVRELGFKPIDARSIGLTDKFKWSRRSLAVQRATWPEKLQAERYQRQRGLWRQGSFCISEGDASKGFTWAADGKSWAKYENVAVDCPPPCTLSVRFRSSSNASFPPQPPQPARRLALAVGAPLEAAEVAAIPAAHSQDWVLLNATVKGGLQAEGATLFLRLSGQCQVDYFFFAHAAQA